MTPELEKVQRFIINKHRELFEESPSPMKLQKLCYYAQGYLMAQGHELFPEDFQAWQHGPVIPTLYSEYKDYGWKSIAKEFPEQPSNLDDFISNELCDIVAAYGRFDGAALSTMTHREKPWIEARGELAEDQGSRAVIEKKTMKTFFNNMLSADDEKQ
ncbi:Panacea domain-containing protein [Pseudomonas syringae group genomosp. 3]|uniref:Panacea domain-containing protein n=1 Tax=Pseudomonas syringae group genomosp. 3 TaxID=251701 RepID=UPI000F0059AF|nr:type II toxin-antitoxin system antitoxin SocA domain-containing protein [Pseudomonas syringae group genomosp. 3]